MLIEAFADESGTGPNDLVHCLAGYIIKPNRTSKMERKWKDVLLKYDIPFFHMTDCAAYKQCEPYKSLGREKCINLACELIWLIKMHCLQGFAFCFNPRSYALYELDMGTQNPYCYSLNLIHLHLHNLVKALGVHEVGVRCFFEAGHRDQKCAKRVLDALLVKDKGRCEYAFADKRESVLLQSADILAWHCIQYVHRRIAKRPARLDFKSLVEIPHVICHLSNPVVEGVRRRETTALSYDAFPSVISPEMEERLRQIYMAGGIVP